MPPPQQQSSQGGDSSLGPFWVLAGLFALIWGVWYFAHEYIATFVLQAKLAEANLIHWATKQAAAEIAAIKGASPASISFEGLANISNAVGDYLRYPIAGLLGLFAVLIYLTNPIMRFKKTYNMNALVATEKDIWPQITPISGAELVKTDIDVGPWAMALSPMQFAKKFNLLQLERVVATESLTGHGRIIANVKREDAQRIFTLQLGRYWRGLDHVSIHTKALFAIFAARADRDRDGAAALLAQIAASTKTGKLNFNGVNELLNKHKNFKEVQKVCNKHAFVLTVMASMLRLARTDGVLATTDFLWLKPIDRPLWFMLNSVGRQTPFPEISGPFAHWLAENKIGRKLRVPMVEEAVNGLDVVIKDIIYIPEESEEVAV